MEVGAAAMEVWRLGFGAKGGQAQLKGGEGRRAGTSSPWPRPLWPIGTSEGTPPPLLPNGRARRHDGGWVRGGQVDPGEGEKVWEPFNFEIETKLLPG